MAGTEREKMQCIVTAMVTKRRVPIQKPPRVRRTPFYLREWRKFMGVSAPVCADAIGIERESYLRIERETWRLNLGEVETLATVIGIKSSQFRFPPPSAGQQEHLSLDELIEDVPENVRQMAIAAVRGMVGK